MVAGRHMGWVVPDFARELAAYPQVFYLTDHEVHLHDVSRMRKTAAAPSPKSWKRCGWREKSPAGATELYPGSRHLPMRRCC